jgi:hypothetical protein
MNRILSGLVLLLVAAVPADAQDTPPTPAKQYQALTKEFSTSAGAFWRADSDQERNDIVARIGTLPPKFLQLAENNPKDPIALDALVEVVSQEYWLNTHTSHPGWGKESPQAKAIALILRDHLNSEKLGDACRRVHYGFRPECETLLRAALEKSPHREVQGLACLRLAQFLGNRIERLHLIAHQPDLARRYENLYGSNYLASLRRQDYAKAMQEAESLYEQAGEKYGDVKLPYDGTVAETAKRELYEIRHLAVGRVAPDIEGLDQDGRQFKLSDYRGKVVLLYFWSEF